MKKGKRNSSGSRGQKKAAKDKKRKKNKKSRVSSKRLANKPRGFFHQKIDTGTLYKFPSDVQAHNDLLFSLAEGHIANDLIDDDEVEYANEIINEARQSLPTIAYMAVEYGFTYLFIRQYRLVDKNGDILLSCRLASEAAQAKKIFDTTGEIEGYSKSRVVETPVYIESNFENMCIANGELFVGFLESVEDDDDDDDDFLGFLIFERFESFVLALRDGIGRIGFFSEALGGRRQNFGRIAMVRSGGRKRMDFCAPSPADLILIGEALSLMDSEDEYDEEYESSQSRIYQAAREKTKDLVKKLGGNPDAIVFDSSPAEIAEIVTKAKTVHNVNRKPLSLTIASYTEKEGGAVVRSTVVLADRASGRHLMQREVWENEGGDETSPGKALSLAISEAESLVSNAGLSDLVHRVQVENLPLVDFAPPVTAGKPQMASYGFFSDLGLDQSEKSRPEVTSPLN